MVIYDEKSKYGSKNIDLGWKVVELSSVAKVTRLAGYEYSTYWKEEQNGRIIALRGFNIGKNKILLKDIVRISNDLSLKLKRSRLCKGDVIYPCVGTIGNAAVVREDDKYHIQQNIARIIPDTNHIDSDFLSYFLMSDFGIKEVQRFNGTSSQPNVLVGSLRQYRINLPDLNVQKSIVRILSDVDNLNSSLEKLIEKKKAIKQGAMQGLLTGKKRLDGFNGKIEFVALQTLCNKFCDGDWIEAKDQARTGFRLIQTGNIGVGRYLNKENKKRYITEETFERLNCTEVKENDVLVSRLPEPAGRACIIFYSKERMITAVDCTIIRFSEKYNSRLFVQYTQMKEYQDQVAMALGGSTRQRISRKELGLICIPIYPTAEEQNEIADLLSDMDKEIEQLEKKLIKYHQIKLGMMQELLAGRICLV